MDEWMNGWMDVVGVTCSVYDEILILFCNDPYTDRHIDAVSMTTKENRARARTHTYTQQRERY